MASNLTQMMRTPPSSNPQSPRDERSQMVFSPTSSVSASISAAAAGGAFGGSSGSTGRQGHDTPSSSSSVAEGTDHGTYTTSRAPSR